MGVFFGLVLGKPIGISLFSYLAVKLGVAERPAGSTWRMLVAVACLGGIGFTMSIFVDSLAFDSETQVEFINMGKIAILIASTTAAIVGSLMIISEAKRENRG